MAAETKTSLRSVIETSLLIQSGSPNIYRLNPVTEIIEGLKKVTLGKKNVSKLNKTILLVGETGTGKSTLINVLVNYVIGVKWEDDVWFEIVQEDAARQSESQTSDVTMYQIFGFEGKTVPFSLTIIDTPGYGDNREDKDDNTIAERLLEWFTSAGGVHEVSAVGLVLKATENRLSDRLCYIFESVLSLFGQNMEKNMFPFLTHSDGGSPDDALQALEDAEIKCAKDSENQPLYFMFNNRQRDPRTRDRDQRSRRFMSTLKSAWDLSEEEMRQFMEVLKATEAQTVRTTVDVITQRNNLKACIVTLQEKLKFIMHKKTQIDQERALYLKCKEKMAKNEDYEDYVDEPYKEKQAIEGGRWGFLWLNFKGATSCLKCEETCHHEGCIYSTSPYDPRCSIFDDNGRCEACSHNCERKLHVKEKWIYVVKTRKVKKTYDDIKKKYEEGKEGAKKHRDTVEEMQKEMDSLLKEEHDGLEKCYQHIITLKKIALKVDSAFTLKHMDFLIGRMKDKKFAEKASKLEEMKKCVRKNIRRAMEYEAKKKKETQNCS